MWCHLLSSIWPGVRQLGHPFREMLLGPSRWSQVPFSVSPGTKVPSCLLPDSPASIQVGVHERGLLYPHSHSPGLPCQQVAHRLPSMSAICQALGNAQWGTSTSAIINPQFIEEETEARSIYIWSGPLRYSQAPNLAA